MPERPFHLAFPILDLEATRAFYAGLLRCEIGREDARWIDFDFFGHQITGHVVDGMPEHPRNPVDGDPVPTMHFGAVLDWDEWQTWSEELGQAGIDFLIEPHVRFQGEVGEQATMFFRDPSGNAIELKAFRDPARLFASE